MILKFYLHNYIIKISAYAYFIIVTVKSKKNEKYNHLLIDSYFVLQQHLLQNKPEILLNRFYIFLR